MKGETQSHHHRSTPKIVLLVTILFALLIIISLYNPFLSQPLLLLSSRTTSSSSSSSSSSDDAVVVARKEDDLAVDPRAAETCDIFTGEWVPNPRAPYYTNKTCWAIHEHQNCMKYGRPDDGFMKWRWKPHGCELPLFNPAQFLELVRGKSMAFVGDSVARNQMQSMICLLSRVEYPIDVSHTPDENYKRWRYLTYNFTLANFWTPHLVKSMESDPNGPSKTGLFSLHLDQADDKWTSEAGEFDYLIISAGHWFYRSLVFYENSKIVGCHFCLLENVPDLTKFYGYRKAFRTAFKAINGLKNYKGITYLRTYTPSHFEGGIWNQGGNCLRTRPSRSNETTLADENLELYMIQVEEFRKAEQEGREKGLKYRLLDTTQAMLLRPDGHPSRYGHWAHENVTLYNDCVHWCLPGAIDTWGDILLEMLKTEGRRSREEKLRFSDRKLKA
ncbi:protein trichome birefringence-like 19 [Rhodamnia argentea]|uniref:Protein trichome birefringence-like 19 n=1 Tax=Rhodamnia argentea TaxID=178133 RepID=A0A8B8QLN1_9MYRT|nr:protein trichome birefringence-like 19 [Rhodamnia argentea]